MCGEKPPRYSGICTVLGSPPRMRGKVQPLGERGSQAGITPAYAGKSRSVQGPAGNSGDHPRVCGEKLFRFILVLHPLGSPPRMRGKVCLPDHVGKGGGITPACAGKRPLPSSGDTRGWDHPRVCGEKFKPFCLRQLCQGSPPRMRGKDDPAHPIAAPAGITPAHAGKSPPIPANCPCRWDHPRVCGEKPTCV